MNYYMPCEIRNRETGEPTGRYHYTVRNDNRIHPVGYCAENCPGHDTPDEARAHYKQYVLDKRVSYHHVSDVQEKCEVCGAWTQGRATVNGYEQYVLCDGHRNRENVERLYDAGDAISS